MDIASLLDMLTRAGLSVAAALGAYVAVRTDIADIRARLALAEKNADYERDRLEKHLDRSRQNTET